MFEYDETQIDSENDEDFACPFDTCDYKDSSLRILQLHVSVLHETLDLKQEVLEHPKNDDINEPIEELQADVDKDFGAKYKCNICLKYFIEERGLKKHITQIHTKGTKNHNCESCGKSFLKARNLKLHVTLTT